MKITQFNVEGLQLLEPKVFGDSRGYFLESYNQNRYDEALGKEVRFVQDNESLSSYGVLRGLHYQLPPFAQSKLVRVLVGQVLDVAIDLRPNSPTFGQHVSVTLSATNHHQLFIPRGFAHGFVVLSEEALFSYKVDNFYSPQAERSIRFDDPALGIDWQVPANKLQLAQKDAAAPTLDQAEAFPTGGL